VSADLRRTPLYQEHVNAGAKLVPFAGWEMPIQYTSIRAEHLAVRARAGIFDVSHMGQILTRGPDALACLQHLSSNDVSRLEDGGAQYSLLCRPDGGVLDDLFSYRLSATEFLTVTNAANHADDLAWFRTHSDSFSVEVLDAADAYAMLAVQGPAARELVAGLSDGPLPERFRIRRGSVAGVELLIAGTGYTGEDGVELLLAPADAPSVWRALLGAGAVPVGLGARDTLRLEACFHLYGNDLSPDRDPISAGLGWAVKEDSGGIGAEANAAIRAAGPSERFVAFALTGPGIPRPGNPVLDGEQGPIGTVTSGSFSPSLERGIGLAYVRADHAGVGTPLTIDVRGTPREAVVASKPLYPKDPADG
jgi:aminomethyltransferase